ncbi:hypothetical protein BT96DRAFT_945816 [Gymnopus androsaceus JB14]|uniref:Uncharacterized protein n=1 Tax=Gymnopus androsaceus JB14 TaxID=1447944 RepID=A0A6A4GZP6_9AGAR|nr:hypothetical protein BT96DRAFT_945816 [Gymnopus androsaceus JB14]
MGSGKVASKQKPTGKRNTGARKAKKDADSEMEDKLADFNSPTLPQSSRPKPRLITPHSRPLSPEDSEAVGLLFGFKNGRTPSPTVYLNEETRKEKRMDDWVSSEIAWFRKDNHANIIQALNQPKPTSVSPEKVTKSAVSAASMKTPFLPSIPQISSEIEATDSEDNGGFKVRYEVKNKLELRQVFEENWREYGTHVLMCYCFGAASTMLYHLVRPYKSASAPTIIKTEQWDTVT